MTTVRNLRLFNKLKVIRNLRLSNDLFPEKFGDDDSKNILIFSEL
jgi:hypothetical protein